MILSIKQCLCVRLWEIEEAQLYSEVNDSGWESRKLKSYQGYARKNRVSYTWVRNFVTGNGTLVCCDCYSVATQLQLKVSDVKTLRKHGSLYWCLLLGFVWETKQVKLIVSYVETFWENVRGNWHDEYWEHICPFVEYVAVSCTEIKWII
jgi:hypothetical protein